MTIKWKKRCSYFCIAVFYILNGIEYAVILPTLWLYIHDRFIAEPYFLGLTLSAFSFAGLFARPLVGRLSDSTGKTKCIFIVCNLFEIAGNVMYFIGVSKWFIVTARLVAGVGSGAGSAIIGDISKTTSVDERTPILTKLSSVRQLGLLIGPALNLFLREFHFDVGPFKVDKFTSPGIFMASLWTLLELLVIFLYFDLLKLKKEQLEHSLVSSHPSYEPVNSGARSSGDLYNQLGSDGHNYAETLDETFLTRSNQMIESAEQVLSSSCPHTTFYSVNTNRTRSSSCDVLTTFTENNVTNVPSKNTPDKNSHRKQSTTKTCVYNTDSGANFNIQNPGLGPHDCSANGSQSPRQQQLVNADSLDIDWESLPLENTCETQEENINFFTWRFFYDEYLREEVIAILASAFVGFFNQVALEAMVTPLTLSLLGWGELENSIMFCLAGVEVLLSFAVLHCLSRYFSDRVLLAIGYFFLVAAVIWFTVWLPILTNGDRTKNLMVLILGMIIDIAGMPFIVVPSMSLFSKITRTETQGFSQGLRGTVVGVALILGPLWAGGLMNHLLLMLSVMLGLLGVAAVMMILSYKYLKPMGVKPAYTAPPSSGDEEEEQPLLS